MIKCDVCGGQLLMNAGGKSATCKVCGMEHSIARVQEMVRAAAPVKTVEPTVPVQPAKPATPVAAPVQPVKPVAPVSQPVKPVAPVAAPVQPVRPPVVQHTSILPMHQIYSDRARAFTDRNRMVAETVYRIADAINDQFEGYQIEYQVDASALWHVAPNTAYPFHFLFRANGRPILAIIVMPKAEIGAPAMQASLNVCSLAGVHFMRFYCDPGFPNLPEYVRNRIWETLKGGSPAPIQQQKPQKKGLFGGFFG